MKELRIHGRGGQGGLTAARIIANAVLKDGMHAQAFPEFGPERRGAPVCSYLRIDEEPILLRTPIAMPDAVVVLDATLLDRPDTVAGIKPGGLLLVNVPTRPTLSLPVATRLAWVDAMGISAELFGRQIPNTAMLGAWCKADGTVSMEALEAIIDAWFPAKHAGKNVQAARRAWEAVQIVDAPASAEPPAGRGRPEATPISMTTRSLPRRGRSTATRGRPGVGAFRTRSSIVSVACAAAGVCPSVRRGSWSSTTTV